MFPNLFGNPQPKLNPLKTNNLKSLLFIDISDQQEVNVVGGVPQKHENLNNQQRLAELRNLTKLTPRIKPTTLDPNSHTTLN